MCAIESRTGRRRFWACSSLRTSTRRTLSFWGAPRMHWAFASGWNPRATSMLSPPTRMAPTVVRCAFLPNPGYGGINPLYAFITSSVEAEETSVDWFRRAGEGVDGRAHFDHYALPPCVHYQGAPRQGQESGASGDGRRGVRPH
jgi:hypothetical protein